MRPKGLIVGCAVLWCAGLQEEFENGFGSHTPMYSGQTKCVRYYMNHDRALGVAKECLQEVRTNRVQIEQSEVPSEVQSDVQSEVQSEVQNEVQKVSPEIPDP
jgi:hypothetical protein